MRGSNDIDAIATSEGIIECVEGSALLSHAEVVNSDHRAYLVETNLEGYFNKDLSYWDDINHSKLDPSRKVIGRSLFNHWRSSWIIAK